MQLILVVMMAAVIAGMVQSVTGFGAGIIVMMVLPYFFPVLTGSAISGSITTVLSIGLAWNYRKYIHKELIAWPLVGYFLTSTLTIRYLSGLKSEILLKLLGICLIGLALYFLFFSDRIHVKGTKTTAIVCAGLSGFLGASFGMSGPPMVIYYLAVLDKKEEYLGTLQTFFSIGGSYVFVQRVFSGIYTMDMVPLTLCGIAAILFGKEIGRRIIDRIDEQKMRKLIYLFLIFTGVLNLL